MPIYSSYNALGSSIEAGELGAGAVTLPKIGTGTVHAPGNNLIMTQNWTAGAGTWVWSLNNTWLNYWVNCTSATVNDYYESMDTFIPEGTYSIYLLGQGGGGSGQLTLALDGTDKGVFDTYKVAGGTYVHGPITGVAVTGASQKIRLTITGKNGSSSGYSIQMSALVFVQTG